MLFWGEVNFYDLRIGFDIINAPTAISASNISDFGPVTDFSAAEITSSLNTLGADSAATFAFDSRTFLAINDSSTGFDSTKDALIEITNFTGNLDDLAIV